MAVVPMIPGSDRQCNDGSKDEDQVHDDENGLQLSHKLGHYRYQDSVADKACEEDAIYSSIGRSPLSVTSNDDDGEEHESKAICEAWSE